MGISEEEEEVEKPAATSKPGGFATLAQDDSDAEKAEVPLAPVNGSLEKPEHADEVYPASYITN